MHSGKLGTTGANIYKTDQIHTKGVKSKLEQLSVIFTPFKQNLKKAIVLFKRVGHMAKCLPKTDLWLVMVVDNLKNVITKHT